MKIRQYDADEAGDYGDAALCFPKDCIIPGSVAKFKFLVPCLSLRAKFTNQQINGKSRTSEANMVLYVIYF